MNTETKKFVELMKQYDRLEDHDSAVRTLESAHNAGAAFDRALAYERVHEDRINYDQVRKALK